MLAFLRDCQSACQTVAKFSYDVKTQYAQISTAATILGGLARAVLYAPVPQGYCVKSSGQPYPGEWTDVSTSSSASFSAASSTPSTPGSATPAQCSSTVELPVICEVLSEGEVAEDEQLAKKLRAIDEVKEARMLRDLVDTATVIEI